MTPARDVRTARGLDIAVPVPAEIASGAEVHVAVRPERARLAREKPADGLALRGTVRQVLYLGATREFHLDLDGGERGLGGDAERRERAGVRRRRAGVARGVPRKLPRAAGASLQRRSSRPVPVPGATLRAPP